MLCSVVRPITCSGLRTSTRVSRAARWNSASAETPAEVGSLFTHDVEGRRCAEIEDDHRRAVACLRRHGVDDAVRAHLVRVLVKDRHSGLDPGADEHRLVFEVASRGVSQHAVEIRHDRGDDHADEPPVVEPGLVEQGA
jgi:hypothetical protein